MRLLALATLAIAALSMPAHAQDVGEKVNQKIIFGKDECTPSTAEEMVICVRRPEEERFRIPEALRESNSPQNDAWANKVIAYETVGASGTLSCSPSGPGGALGCTQKLIDAHYAEKAGGSEIKMSQLIQAERERRLATIDQDAADAQARVEAIEREYDARQRAAQESAASSSAQQAPLPTTRAPGQ